MQTQYKSALRIFLERVIVMGESECWYWGSTKDSKGYGRFRLNRRTILSHRYSYEYFVGEIPKGLVIDHLCDNPSCVNPKHLEPKTIYENAKRGFKEPRSNILQRGICISGLHSIKSMDDVYQYKKSYTCRKCKSLRHKISADKPYPKQEVINIDNLNERIRERDRKRKK